MESHLLQMRGLKHFIVGDYHGQAPIRRIFYRCVD